MPSRLRQRRVVKAVRERVTQRRQSSVVSGVALFNTVHRVQLLQAVEMSAWLTSIGAITAAFGVAQLLVRADNVPQTVTVLGSTSVRRITLVNVYREFLPTS